MIGEFYLKGENYYFDLKYEKIDIIEETFNLIKNSDVDAIVNLGFLRNCSFSFKERAIRFRDCIKYFVNNRIVKGFSLKEDIYVNFIHFNDEKAFTQFGKFIVNNQVVYKVKKEDDKVILGINGYFGIEICIQQKEQSVYTYKYDFNKLFERVNKDDKMELFNSNGYLFIQKTGQQKSSNEIVKIKSDIIENFYLNGTGEDFGDIEKRFNIENKTIELKKETIQDIINDKKIINTLSSVDDDFGVLKPTFIFYKEQEKINLFMRHRHLSIIYYDLNLKKEFDFLQNGKCFTMNKAFNYNVVNSKKEDIIINGKIDDTHNSNFGFFNALNEIKNKNDDYFKYCKREKSDIFFVKSILENEEFKGIWDILNNLLIEKDNTSTQDNTQDTTQDNTQNDTIDLSKASRVDTKGFCDINIGVKVVKGKTMKNRQRYGFNYLLLKDNKYYNKNGRFIATIEELNNAGFTLETIQENNIKYCVKKYKLQDRAVVFYQEQQATDKQDNKVNVFVKGFIKKISSIKAISNLL